MDGEALPRYAARLVELRSARQWGRRELARRLRTEAARRGENLPDLEHLVRAVRRWESGAHRPSELYRDLLASAYDVPPLVLFGEPAATPAAVDDADDLDVELLELTRRAEASDVGAVVLRAVDLAVTDLARRYTRTPPQELLTQVRRRSRDVVRLLDGRTTLGQRRRLLLAGGWLSLLAATVHVDLGHRVAARIARDTATALGRETGEAELIAWAVEGAAWEAVVDQEWPEALQLSRAGQQIAPAGRSAAVQLAAQEARAAARLSDSHAVSRALHRASGALESQPEGPPDHHFVFDARKLTSYTATALAWMGDPAAEEHALEVIRTAISPRRLATARIDLALVLVGLGRPDEAAALGALAVDSRRLVPSNVWRAGELASALTTRYPDLAESCDYRDRYRTAAASIGVRPERGPRNIRPRRGPTGARA
jgi:transcriptional regulator with XRE-family HTH domain